MIVIADAGGTSTDWRLIDEGQVTQYQMPGFNGRTNKLSEVSHVIPDALKDVQISKLHFYVAGLVESIEKQLNEELRNLLKVEAVQVYPDTLGVARALLGDGEGWVGILGTGSAAFHFDGEKVDQRSPSLGFILGDEGSGVYLGRLFLKRYLRGQFEKALMVQIRTEFTEITETDALEKVYQIGEGKSYLTQFASFLNKHQMHPQIYALLEECFFEYFTAHFEDNRIDSIHLSGSVAFHFGSIITTVARKKTIRINRIIQSPIAGLTLYHEKHG